MLSCPYYSSDYVGICVASDTPFIPDVQHRTRYCHAEEYDVCAIYQSVLPCAAKKSVPADCCARTDACA